MYPQIQILDETIDTCTMIDCRYQARNPLGFYVHGYQHENPIASNQRIYKLYLKYYIVDMKYKKCNSLIQKNIATMDHADKYRPIGAEG